MIREVILTHSFPMHPFSTPLITSENRWVFWCFQGVEKGCTGNEWVKTKRGRYFNQSNRSKFNLYPSNRKWLQFSTNQIKDSGHLQPIKLHTCKILVKGLTFPYGEHVFKHIRKLNPYFFSSSLKRKVQINIISLRKFTTSSNLNTTFTDVWMFLTDKKTPYIAKFIDKISWTSLTSCIIWIFICFEICFLNIRCRRGLALHEGNWFLRVKCACLQI